MAAIAWIGLGHMGAPMAGHWCRPGMRSAASIPCPRRGGRGRRGIHVVDTIAEAVDGADAVFTSLPPQRARS